MKNILKIILIVLIIGFFNLYVLAYNLEVGIPGQVEAGEGQTFITYLKNINDFALAVVGIAALGGLIYGGILWITSVAVDQKKEAKAQIEAALLGLALVLLSYLILAIINPDLTKLNL